MSKTGLLMKEHDYQCLGCGKVERVFFRSGKLPIELKDFTTFPKVKEYSFHSWGCVRKFLQREAE